MPLARDGAADFCNVARGERKLRDLAGSINDKFSVMNPIFASFFFWELAGRPTVLKNTGCFMSELQGGGYHVMLCPSIQPFFEG